MKKPVPRNHHAVAAHHRKAGAHVSHKDLTGRRGGSRNESLDMIAEYEEEMEFIAGEEEDEESREGTAGEANGGVPKQHGSQPRGRRGDSITD